MILSPINAEVALAISTGVTVKSKRNKRPRNDIQLQEFKPSREPSPMDHDSSPPSSPNVAAAHSLSNLAQKTTSVTPAPPISGMFSSNYPSRSPEIASAVKSCSEWGKMVIETLENGLEWQAVAYESVDSKQLPIYRCPSCWVYRDSHKAANNPHHQDCKVCIFLIIYLQSSVSTNYCNLQGF